MIPWRAPEDMADWDWDTLLSALWDAADAVDDPTREVLARCGDSLLMQCLRARAAGLNETLSREDLAEDLPHALSGLLLLLSNHLTKTGERLLTAVQLVLIPHSIAHIWVTRG